MRKPHWVETLFQHLGSAWRRRMALNLFVVFSLFASFTLLDTALIVAKNFEALSQFWGSKVEMNVYLKDGVDRPEALISKIEGHPLVKSVQFVSKDRAFGELQAQLASHAPEILKDPELLSFIPASLLVELKGSKNPEGYLEVVKGYADQLKANEIVADVQFGAGWMDELRTILQVLGNIGALFFTVVLVGSLFMVGFVIRNSLQQRRGEIEILELVGASRWFIRMPFLIEGALISFLAGALSLWVTNSLFARVKSTLMNEDLFLFIAYRLHQFSTAGVILMSLAYALLGAAVSYMCLRHLNTGFAAAESQKRGT
ncbi:MAG: ABC transporter permease [Bdellovibrionaceae bacterium]|nr:ABC transporter permease [Pseudobdellovibrionaceae bacterium]